ncbi:MAG: MASE1 domain-containing protein, partial [Candidatus Omnitrophica bacterium]|nr:MASE1 domain-containing protein [Candidatus Omnitrophota bacterium]
MVATLQQLLNPANYAYNPAAAPTFLTMAAIFVLGIAVLVRERGSLVSVLFFLVTLTVNVWLHAFSWMYCATSLSVALWWAKAAYLGVPLIPSSIYHFTVTCLGLASQHRPIVRLSWFFSCLFSAAIIWTDGLIAGLYQYWWGFYPRYGWLSLPYLTFFFGMTFATLRLYWREYRRATPGSLHRRRVLSLLVAFCIVYLGSIDYLAKFGLPVYPYGYLPVFLFTLLAARAIWRYRLVDLAPGVLANQILNTITGAVLVVDLEGRVRVVNRAACDLLGYRESELLGLPVATVVDPPGHLNLEADRLLRYGAIQHREMTWRAKDRRRVEVSVSASAVTPGNHTPAGTVCVAVDITERKGLDEALMEKLAPLIVPSRRLGPAGEPSLVEVRRRQREALAEPAFEPQPQLNLWRVAGLLTLIYFAAGKFGLSLAFLNASASPVWPPTGIALAALLLWGYRVWPAILVGAFLVNVTTAGTILTSLGIALGNTLEALAGAYLVNRYAHGRRAFDQPHDLLKFVLLAGLIGTAVSATVGVTTLTLGDFMGPTTYGSVWLTWWLGDAVGAIVVTPLVVAWSRRPFPMTPWPLRRVVEAVLAYGALTLAALLVFGSWWFLPTAKYPMAFLCIPPVVWMAFRLGQRLTTAATALLAGIAIWATLHGFGPFAVGILNTSLLLLQAFVGVITCMALMIAAAAAERQHVEEELERSCNELDLRVQERTQSLFGAIETLRNEIVERKRVEQELRQTNALLVRKQEELAGAMASLKHAHDELQATQLQLIQAAKLESVGRLAAGVAHEVKNPLATLLIGLDHLSDHFPVQDENVASLLEDMHQAVRRADEVIKGLLNFAAAQALDVSEENLNTLIEQSLVLVKHELDKNRVSLVKALEPLPALPLDRMKIEQVFVNLFTNAIDAMPSGGTLTVRTTLTQLTAVGAQVGRRRTDRFGLGETVVIAEVEDTGGGIPADKLAKVFDPFFTTKP